MRWAPTLAALLLQLAVHSDALSASHSLEPVQDKDKDKDDDEQDQDTSDKMVDKKLGDGELDEELSYFDLDDENNFAQATDELEDDGGSEEEEHEGSSDKDLITDVDGPFKPSVHYSEQQRKQMHGWDYAAEFVSSLNLTRARETGELLGLQLTMAEEWEPPIVGKVKKWGLVFDWNTKQLAEGHPERQIIVGDQIVKVNKVTYHHNAKTFAKRIGDQFYKTRKLTTRPNIELYVRRKKRDEAVYRRTDIQREDRHKFLYVKEWVPEMETTKVGKNWPLDSTMGWKLNYDKYWKPVVISEIKSYGLVADWNKAHPKDKIVVGDQLVQIDGYGWDVSHNSDLFLKRVHDRTRHLIQAGKALKLGIRRPREVQEALGEPIPSVAEREHDASGEGDDVVMGAEEDEGELGSVEDRKAAKELPKVLPKELPKELPKVLPPPKKAEDEHKPKVLPPREAEQARLAKNEEDFVRASKTEGKVDKRDEKHVEADELERHRWETRPKAPEGQQIESPKTSIASRSRLQDPEYAEKVTSARSKMERLASAWEDLESDDIIAIASELLHKALESGVEKSVRSAQHGH